MVKTDQFFFILPNLTCTDSGRQPTSIIKGCAAVPPHQSDYPGIYIGYQKKKKNVVSSEQYFEGKTKMISLTLSKIFN